MIVAVIVSRFGAERVMVASASMRPTLSPGDHVVLDKMSFRFRAPRRGEVVVIDDPHGRGSLVKRVVALGGDEVELDNGVLIVNGKAVPRRGELPNLDVAEFFGPAHVPEGSVFVLGDNRGESDDSREFGPVTHDHLIGRVWFEL
jgi:signal peptidase I